MKIVYMGTPEFAVPSLDMLIMEGYEISAVVTQPDKPKGRGNKLEAPPVKKYALEKGIKILQPVKIKTPEFEQQLKELSPDLIVVVAYGKILPKNILEMPPYGCINVHGSLLPKYRGSAPIQWSVIKGEAITGVTTMYMDVGMDTGDMLVKKEIEVSNEITSGELYEAMSFLGAQALKETMEKLESGTLERTHQINSEATSAPMMTKETGKIDWSKSAQEIHNLVRGTNPWPGAYTFYKGDRMRVWKTRIIDTCGMGIYVPGSIAAVESGGIVVSTGSGFIEILEIQFDSCRKMCVGDYICGHQIDEGEVIG